MLRNSLRSVNLTHISLALVGLMWVLPFLYYDHPIPIASFYAEWLAAILGVCAMFLLATQRFWQQLIIPRITLLPAALALLVLIQFAIGRGVYIEQSVLFAMYLFWAALLIILGRYLREELGLPTMAIALAVSLLIGAELSALIGVLQHYSWHSLFGFPVMAKDIAFVMGNMGQSNHFANFTTLGLVSLVLLHARWNLRVWQLLLLAAPLLFVLVLSGSRSPWLYLAGMTSLAYLWQRRDKTCKPLLQASLLLLLGFGLMHLVVQMPWLTGTHGNVTAAQRVVEASGVAGTAGGAAAGGSIRFAVWNEAWVMFVQHPLLGAGFGQFPWQHFQLGPVLRDGTLSNLNDYVEHAHNLVLNLAAETGLAGLLILFGALWLWLAQAYRAPRTVYHWWGYGVLGVLAIHSMLEYPLWYTFFLGIAAVVLGMFDVTGLIRRQPGKARMAGRWAMFAVLLAGVLVLSQLVRDYRSLVRLSDRSAGRPTSAALVEMQGRATLLQPYFETLLGETGWDHFADRHALNERVMRYAPAREAVLRQVLWLAREGRQEEARAQIERVIWTYPGEATVMIDRLGQLALMGADPARFSALRDFALQKREAWRQIIHPRGK